MRRHVVVEKYERVIDLFTARQPHRPSTLEIVEADFFDHIHRVEPASLDGIFFDPFLPAEMGQDEKWSTISRPRISGCGGGSAWGDAAKRRLSAARRVMRL